MPIIGDSELRAKLELLKTKTPNVLARTLTGLAYEARAEVQRQLPQWVNTTRPFLKNSVVYVAATTSDLTAKVGFDQRANFATLLEDGGIRTPKQSSSLAVPTADLRRTARGGISSANRPRNVLMKKGTFIGIPEGHKKPVFGIWKKFKGEKLSLLYVFKRKTTYRKKYLKFRETVAATVQAKSRDRFFAAFQKAIQDIK